MESNVKLGVIGCGKMASAILGGVYKNSYIKSENIFLYDIDSNSSNLLKSKYNFNVCENIESLIENIDVIFLAVKPFVLKDIISEIKKYYKNNLILSILAGVKLEKYNSFLPDSKVIRIMPNTPALIGEGMSAICSSSNVSVDEADFAYNLMKNCGSVIKVDEDKMDIITALSASGPAYYFKIIDEMAKAAVSLGLDYNKAILLSAQTALGSAKLLMENNFDVKTLIKNVTTPGGCTEVGNNVLNNSNISDILLETIDKTTKKAQDLGR